MVGSKVVSSEVVSSEVVSSEVVSSKVVSSKVVSSKCLCLKQRPGRKYSMLSLQVEKRLSVADYFSVSMMSSPLTMSSMPCNRSRWRA